MLATQGLEAILAGSLPRTMSESVVLQQPGSVLISMAPLAIEDCLISEAWATTWGCVGI